MSDKKRLLVLTSTFPRWSGDREPGFVFELSRRLAGKFEVMVLAPHAQGALRREMLGGVTVHRFRYCIPAWQTLAYQGGIMANLRANRLRYLLVPLFVLAEFFSLVFLLRKHPVDVIHAHWSIPQGLVALTARRFSPGSRPAVLCTSHGTDLLGLRGAFFAALQRWVMRHAEGFTVVSEALKSHAVSLDAQASPVVIPMGGDLAIGFTPADEGARSHDEILYVGRLAAKKGVDQLLRALSLVLQRRPQACLTVVGAGPERRGLEALAVELGVQGCVRFEGAMANHDLPPMYRRAAVCVLPSLEEGLGLTLVEALGCECPVVASDLPAIRDVVIHQQTGWLVPPGDPVALADGIIGLLGHPPLRRQLAVQGRQHVLMRFDWESVVSRYRDVIAGLSGPRGHASATAEKSGGVRDGS